MNTTENNILIAEFMGAIYMSHINAWFIMDEECSSEELKYNSSWNWLMEVVEKIESHNLENVNCITFLVKISNTNCQIIDLFKDRFEINVYGNTKIDAVYKAVIKFIKWYNENKNNH